MSAANTGENVVPVLRPLTARSVVLSLLLGAHPPSLAVRDLVRAAGRLDISDTTLRVALTRMVAAGDLYRAAGTYSLTERLLARQRRQDASVHPAMRVWRGAWEMVVITASGRSSTARATLRSQLALLRLAELREGIWMRPANLKRAWPGHLDTLSRRFTGRPEGDPAGLAAELWDLRGWAASGRALLDVFADAALPSDRFTIAAAMVRHLLTDPMLPAELLPPEWPAEQLRAAYAAYQLEVRSLGG